MKNSEEIKPSDLIDYYDILDTTLCVTDATAGHPDWYDWYEKDGKYYPHRKPTGTEWENDNFK